MEYGRELQSAVGVLSRAGIRTSIYNSQLCVLPKDLHHFARRSISDWKQQYLPVCDQCSARERCAGFFETSGTKISQGIAPIIAEAA